MGHRAEIMEIEDIHVFEVMNNRFRHRIMRELVEPMSVKALAGILEVPVTRLYYHVNQLADVGLIRVVDERKVGAILEKIYQTSAQTFRPGKKLLEADRDPAEMARIAAAVVLDPARVDAEAMLTREFAKGVSTDMPGTLGRGQAMMTRSRAAEFEKRVEALLAEMETDDDDEDAVECSVSVVFAPLGEL